MDVENVEKSKLMGEPTCSLLLSCFVACAGIKRARAVGGMRVGMTLRQAGGHDCRASSRIELEQKWISDPETMKERESSCSLCCNEGKKGSSYKHKHI